MNEPSEATPNEEWAAVMLGSHLPAPPTWSESELMFRAGEQAAEARLAGALRTARHRTLAWASSAAVVASLVTTIAMMIGSGQGVSGGAGLSSPGDRSELVNSAPTGSAARDADQSIASQGTTDTGGTRSSVATVGALEALPPRWERWVSSQSAGPGDSPGSSQREILEPTPADSQDETPPTNFRLRRDWLSGLGAGMI